MSERLNQITGFLNKELRTKKIADSSKNGLQVKCREKVKRIGFAVDGSLSTFEKAKKAKVDMLIVHHGIKWKPQKRSVVNNKRENFLKKNKISLYASHLPLDAHYKYGNNIQLCSLLDLINIKKFCRYHGKKIGYSGAFKKPTNLMQISNILNKKLKTKCFVHDFGKKNIKNIAIVSGGGSAAIGEASNENFDCFLVGDINLGAYNWAKDLNLSLIVAGHYATETLGVKSLQDLLKQKFNVKTIFIDNYIAI